jgi:hypothetical protein
MSAESTAWVEILKFVGQGFFVFVGWYVVNRLSITRDRDKSRREMVTKTTDSLCECVDKLFSDAREYHTKERDTAKEFHIKNGFQDLSFRIASLSKLVEEEHYHRPCIDAVIHFRQAVTKDHFEDEHIERFNGSEHQIELIAESALALKRSLVELKHIQFPFERNKPRWCC